MTVFLKIENGNPFLKQSFLKQKGDMYLIKILWIIVCLLQGVSHSMASEDHEQHGSHEHGKARLNLVQEGNELEIEIHSPSVNVVGFEHQPKTAEQKKTAKQATQSLKEANQIFTLPASAQCRLKESEVRAFVTRDHDDDHHDDDDHDNDHHDDDEQEATHSEFYMEYEFACNAPQNLKSVELHLFKRFPGFEEVDAQIITSSGQTSQELTPDQSTLNF